MLGERCIGLMQGFKRNLQLVPEQAVAILIFLQ